MVGMKPAIDRLFEDYAAHHRTRGNHFCHSVGIPLILITLLGLLSRIQFDVGLSGLLDGGVILLTVAMVGYLWLDWKLALPFGLFVVGGYALGKSLPLEVQCAGFVMGWIFQGIGHRVFEKNSPAFFSNVRHLLIGPFWLFAGWVRYSRSV
jgi:uncharacterized membrane protein YGL010W